jgi:glycosyltransferase involved in cell wall biosynthesis
LRCGSEYQLILPQDGVATGAFAALAGWLTGVRTVCMDHGSITLLNNPAFRREHANALRKYLWHQSVRSVIHWPSIYILAWISTRCADLLLVAGDEVEDVYRKHFGVHISRIMRYAYMVDARRFTPPSSSRRAEMREARGISSAAIVITLINRLAPEKGLDVALEGIAQALETLETEVRAKVRIVIAGDGPLRAQLEGDIRRYELASTCILWGVATPEDVVMLLGMTDIFLYAGTRGTNYSVAVLEAMAAGCAVVASVVPQSNVRLLAGGRGIAVAPGNANEVFAALVRLCNDPALCRRMGELSRAYIERNHNAHMLERSLLRASFFAPPITLDAAQSDDLPAKDSLKEPL